MIDSNRGITGGIQIKSSDTDKHLSDGMRTHITTDSITFTHENTVVEMSKHEIRVWTDKQVVINPKEIK